MDSDHSYPDIAPMHDILQDALDDLVSNRTSVSTKGDALVTIEHVLAETCDPRAVGLQAYFNSLQDSFQCNVSSRIIAWGAVATAILERYLNKGSLDDERKTDMETLSTQLAQGMAIIQGVALVHKPSKHSLGRRYSLEILLDLLLVSRHLGSSPTSSSAPTTPKQIITTPPKSQEIPLASIVIDTLLCILVDSIPALRAFEDLNGVQVVVRILKRAGTPREVRMKCLEFLYFYLLDETVPPNAISDPSASNPVVSDVIARTPSPGHQAQASTDTSSQSGYTTRHSSRSSSSSSAFSVLSTSTTATSNSLHHPQSRSNHEHTPPNSTTQSIAPGFPRPSSRNVTPPTRNLGALGRGQPRSLAMLKTEVDFVPLSPKKPQLSQQLGRGPSGLRPKITERSFATRLRDVSARDSDVSGDNDSVTSSSASGAPSDISSTPRNQPATPRTHARGQSVSSSLASPAASSIPTPRPGETSRAKANPSSAQPTPHPMSKLHRRTQSLADFVPESPGQGGGPRSASSPTAGISHETVLQSQYRGARTMEEKKEILGTMLGNVDALVEGVKKAGVWGLS